MKKNILLGGLIGFAVTLSLECAEAKTPKLGKNSIDEVIAAMTQDEKATLTVGTGMSGMTDDVEEGKTIVGETQNIVPGTAGTTQAIERLGITSVVMADGPSGVRLSPTREGDKNTYYATAYPIPTALASSWNTELVKEAGKLIGNEVLEYGVDVLLAPALNIHRYPLAGRNFEYYSEDPLISGKMAAAMVAGIQSNGVGTSLKHFAANNQETNRAGLNTIVSQRALREIYLKGFEIAVTEARPLTVMSSYNKINGVYTSQSKQLLVDVLRNDWGFEGAVMTDWYGGADPVAQMNAQNNLLMPGTQKQKNTIIEALKSGKLSEKTLDENVKAILKLVVQTPRFRGYKHTDKPDLKAHAKVARQLASESMVLLKNDNNALPLKKVKSVATFGFNSYDFLPIGAGSGEVNYPYEVSLVEGINNSNYKIDKELEKVYKKYIAEAKKHVPQPKTFMDRVIQIPEMEVSKKTIEQKAKKNDVALISIGRISGEFRDRTLTDEQYNIGDYYLSKQEIDLIKNVTEIFRKHGKKTILMLNIGGTIELTQVKDLPDAILLAWQPGMEGGNALADILSGKENPSGRLATTFIASLSDASGTFPGIPANDPKTINYDEDIFVGYRYYDAAQIEPLYPFGYGLSYTAFALSNLEVKRSKNTTKVKVKVKNTGSVAGKEVVQVYVAAPTVKLSQPVQQLRAFGKTKTLKPGESETMTFELSDKDIASFDETQSAWILEPGKYEVRVGTSSRDIKTKADFDIKSEILVQKVTNSLAPQHPVLRMIRR